MAPQDPKTVFEFRQTGIKLFCCVKNRGEDKIYPLNFNTVTNVVRKYTKTLKMQLQIAKNS